MKRITVLLCLFSGLLLLPVAPTGVWAQDSDTANASVAAPPPSLPDTSRDADVPFVRTPKEIVVRMLELANVTSDDVVYDLGSGDGRIPITAAQRYGAQSVGIEIKPDLVEKARARAQQTVVDDLVEFRQGDLFKADFSEATVVTLYLLPDVNTKLRPRLFEQLDPGTRVVSHGFDMGEWEADRVVKYQDTFLFLWTIPEEVPPHLKK